MLSSIQPTTLIELLRHRAQNQPDKPAYTFLVNGETEELSLTYAQLDQRVRAIAAKLQDRVTVGDRVLLLYPAGLDYIAAFFACLYAGVVAVPTYPPRRNRPDPRIQAIVADAQATVVLTTTDILSGMEQRLAHTPELKNLRWLVTDNLTDDHASAWQEPAIHSDTLAFLQYTSGSTGTPKGVMVSHGNLQHNSEYIKQAFELTSDSVSVTWLPSFHDMGLIDGIIQPLYTGFIGVIMPSFSFIQRPFRWLKAISHYRATHCGGPNFGYELCVRKIDQNQRKTLDLSSWFSAYNGAEPIRLDTLERFTEAFKSCGFRANFFYPCYGMAETTLMVSGGRVKDEPVCHTVQADALEQKRIVAASEDTTKKMRPIVGCGRSWLDTRIVIADPESLTQCTSNQVGEIWVSGRSIAQGYWNRPKETEQTFNAYLADTGDGPFLRTGDLGFLKEGELFVTGRLKDLIIIRGMNHYPQDIELTVEKSYPILRPGCSAAFSVEVNGEERLVVAAEVERRFGPRRQKKQEHEGADRRQVEVVASVEPKVRQPLNIEEAVSTIRQAVSEQHDLPVYAVLLIKMGRIPKTSSGKIQRRACREQFLGGGLDIVGEWRQDLTEKSDSLVLPSQKPVSKDLGLPSETAIQNWLLTKLSEQLKIAATQIDVREPLTRYGLDSVMAFRLSGELETWLDRQLSPTLLYDYPSIQAIAQYLAGQLCFDTAVHIRPINRDQPLPLSFTQEEIWLFHQLKGPNTIDNMPIALRLEGRLHRNALEQSFQALVQRHESLRTYFPTVKGTPVVQLSTISYPLSVINRQALPPEEQALEVQRLVNEEDQHIFDLSKGPLFRSTLLQLGVESHVLLLNMHHIISDGWSWRIFLYELSILYKAFSQGKPSPLPPLPIQPVDFAHWQRQRLKGEVLDKQLDYWKQQLAGAPALLELPTDHPRPPVQGERGASLSMSLSPDLTARLKTLSQQAGTTLFMTLLSALATLFCRYSGQTDIIIATLLANRTHKQLESLIGLFLNTLILRLNLEGNPPFNEVLQQARRVTLEAYAHSDISFMQLVEALQPKRDLSHMPLFQVMFDPQDIPSDSMEWPGLKIESLIQETSTTGGYDLELMTQETDQGLVGTLVYNTDLFEQATIERLIGHFQTLLEGIVENPQQPIHELPLLLGRIDRPERSKDSVKSEPLSSRGFVAPRTPEEERLAGIWAESLGLERVGIHDNFFELGGHSRLAAQVMSQIGETFCCELPLRLIFESQTLAGLSEHLPKNL